MIASDAEPVLDLHGLAKVYDRTVALHAITLRLEAGGCLALLGANGSGKTTLLKILAGATSPTLGGGTVCGHDLGRERASLRGVVGLLAADSYLYEELNAIENLRFTLTMAGRKPSRADLAGVIQRVGLVEAAEARVRTFSSGMRRRLSLARVLLLEPRLVLLDEPYNSLDRAAADLVDELVAEWRSHGQAVVLATHDAERAASLAGTVVVLDRGALLYSGAVHGYRMRHAQHVG